MSGNASPIVGRCVPAPAVATTDAANPARINALRETRASNPPVRVRCTEAQLVTLMGLVREYTRDEELYDTLARALP